MLLGNPWVVKFRFNGINRRNIFRIEIYLHECYVVIFQNMFDCILQLSPEVLCGSDFATFQQKNI